MKAGVGTRGWSLLAASVVALAMPAAVEGEPERTTEVPAAPLCVGKAKDAPARPPVLVDGLGYAGIEPDTDNEEARRWFAQGVRFIWAFDEAEAARAFIEAQKLAPDCALCFWGEAWARSPTINLVGRSEELPAARAAAAKAASLGGGLGERDKALIEAMRLRTAGAKEFDVKGHADRMEALAKRFPADDTIAVMAADARMQTWSDAVIAHGTVTQQLLETVLARTPGHTGAIHFHIHLSDWIEDQQLAEAGADRLGRLAPAASHLVHMPSHTFYGIGRYRDAMNANLAAIAADKAYAAKVQPPGTDYRDGLNQHNTNFVIGSALMIGEGRIAIETADHFRGLYAEEKNDSFFQFPRASVFFAYGAHGSVAQVEALPANAANTPLLRAMRHYALGEAKARAGDTAGVRAEAVALRAARRTINLPPDAKAWGTAMLEIAQHVLEGRAAMAEGRYKAAETAFRKAMAKQKKARFSTDPPTWWYPVRRSVAAAQIARGDNAGAREQLLASLRIWPNDPVAYALLAKAERGLGRAREADAYLAQARAGWTGDIEAVTLVLS